MTTLHPTLPLCLPFLLPFFSLFLSSPPSFPCLFLPPPSSLYPFPFSTHVASLLKSFISAQGSSISLARATVLPCQIVTELTHLHRHGCSSPSPTLASTHDALLP
ncbi:hypothetical protein AAZX31_07G105500 [Glycine max]